MMILPHNRSLEIISQANSEVKIAGRVISEPQSKDVQLSIVITDVVINNQLKLNQTQLYITAPQNLSIKAGDDISFNGKISQGIGRYSGFV